MQDDFGDRMKGFEQASSYVFNRGKPICARIDGRGFSKFTKGLDKPFDDLMTICMQETTKYLVEKTGANIGYTQSDEISLVWANDGDHPIPFFAGKVQKMVSVLAGMTTAAFTKAVVKNMLMPPDELFQKMPTFDSRVWLVPTKVEATNTLLWRAQDARRNGISSACHVICGHNAMQGANQNTMLDMMAERDVCYHRTYTDEQKYGSFFQRVTTTGVMSQETWFSIPEEKRPWPPEEVTRHHVQQVPCGFFGDVADKMKFVFGEEV